MRADLTDALRNREVQDIRGTARHFGNAIVAERLYLSLALRIGSACEQRIGSAHAARIACRRLLETMQTFHKIPASVRVRLHNRKSRLTLNELLILIQRVNANGDGVRTILRAVSVQPSLSNHNRRLAVLMIHTDRLNRLVLGNCAFPIKVVGFRRIARAESDGILLNLILCTVRKTADRHSLIALQAYARVAQIAFLDTALRADRIRERRKVNFPLPLSVRHRVLPRGTV